MLVLIAAAKTLYFHPFLLQQARGVKNPNKIPGNPLEL
jgi:hypothetical protein